MHKEVSMGIFESIKNAFSSKAESDAAEHPPEVEAGPGPAPSVSRHDVDSTGSGPDAASGNPVRSYTVLSGDTLWKIAQEMYGDGSRYMRIFEANTGLLKNPDQIFPGQTLVIPDAGENH